MNTTVAVVRIDNNYPAALRKAIQLIGGIDFINTPDRNVTIKIGLFDPRMQHHSSVAAVGAIVDAFDCAPHIYLAESDNYCAKALARLERFHPICSERVTPHSLSDDSNAITRTIAGEAMALSHVLIKPNVIISTHVLRTFARGSILKNLFGCTPMVQKAKYHKTEIFLDQLCDLFEASGGIDLAVLDGAVLTHGASEITVPMDLLVVGRDAVAVETVGAMLAGLKPEKMEVIQAFVRRGLGVGDLSQIDIVGIGEAELKELKRKPRELKKLFDAKPKGPGISGTIDLLTEEGWMDAGRTAVHVAEELQSRGIGNATREMVDTTLKRRVGKTLERAKENGVWIYRRKQA